MLGSNFAMNTRELIRKLQTLLTYEFISTSSFVSISYSPSEKFAAQYLQLALESIGVVPVIVESSQNKD